MTAFAFDYIVNYSSEDKGWVASIIGDPDLILSAFGNSKAEAIEELKKANDLFMESEKEDAQ